MSYDVRLEDKWEVRDAEGVLFDGPYEEMWDMFNEIVSGSYDEPWYPPLELTHAVKVAE